jgi:hypothetical protein
MQRSASHEVKVALVAVRRMRRPMPLLRSIIAAADQPSAPERAGASLISGPDYEAVLAALLARPAEAAPGQVRRSASQLRAVASRAPDRPHRGGSTPASGPSTPSRKSAALRSVPQSRPADRSSAVPRDIAAARAELRHGRTGDGGAGAPIDSEAVRKGSANAAGTPLLPGRDEAHRLADRHSLQGGGPGVGPAADARASTATTAGDQAAIEAHRSSIQSPPSAAADGRQDSKTGLAAKSDLLAGSRSHVPPPPRAKSGTRAMTDASGSAPASMLLQPQLRTSSEGRGAAVIDERQPPGADSADLEPRTGGYLTALDLASGDGPSALDPPAGDYPAPIEPRSASYPGLVERGEGAYPGEAESWDALYPDAAHSRAVAYPGAVEPRAGSPLAGDRAAADRGAADRGAGRSESAGRAAGEWRQFPGPPMTVGRGRPEVASASDSMPKSVEPAIRDPAAASGAGSPGASRPAAIEKVSRPAARIDPARLDDSGTFLAEAAWRNGVDAG